MKNSALTVAELEQLVFPMPTRNLTAQEHRELVKVYHAYKKYPWKNKFVFNTSYRPWLCSFSSGVYPKVHDLMVSLLYSKIVALDYNTLSVALGRLNPDLSTRKIFNIPMKDFHNQRLVWLRKLIAH